MGASLVATHGINLLLGWYSMLAHVLCLHGTVRGCEAHTTWLHNT